MSHAKSPTRQATLEEVTQQFKTWRATRRRKSRIAAELWDAAVSLTDQYSIHRISRTLKLNHSALRDQVAARTHEKCLATAQQACFLELPAHQPSPSSECLIEMENRHGEKMRMHFAGGVSLDFFALIKNFWARRP
jgi:hypothetical protein